VASDVRLDFNPRREEEELRAYLGEAYDHGRLQRYEATLEDEFDGEDEARFYRTSRGYLYNLTAFAMTGTKLPYLRELVGRLPPGSRILDYGCGIGSDGLMLLEAGFRVEFADFDNPSTEYLRWRLERRGLEAAVHDLDAHVPGGFDAAYAFDVIEHVPDPVAFLEEMESRARLVEVNLLVTGTEDHQLHYELPIRELLLRTSRRGLVLYRVLYRRSHLVLYRPGEVGPARRLVNLGRLAAGRVRLAAGRES
jgi:SAM-dependent methyltransferase